MPRSCIETCPRMRYLSRRGIPEDQLNELAQNCSGPGWKVAGETVPGEGGGDNRYPSCGSEEVVNLVEQDFSDKK